jgi:hypothetical protein
MCRARDSSQVVLHLLFVEHVGALRLDHERHFWD